MFERLFRGGVEAAGLQRLRAWAAGRGIAPLFISPRPAGWSVHFTVAVATEAEAARLGDPAAALVGVRRARAEVVAQETIDRDYQGSWFNWFR